MFVEAVPALEQILSSPFARGAVSGIGAVTAIAGLTELASAFGARRRATQQAPPNADHV
jgi:hypothetical protein